MSTKAIRQLIEDATADHPMTPRLTSEGIKEALAEVEAIEKAARVISDDATTFAIERKDVAAVDAAIDLIVAISEGTP